ncbi:MAG: DNA alkylation repair protein [Chloroflexota bacterium]
MNAHPYLHPLKHLLEQHRDAEKAEPMAKYMRNLFPFLGIKTPERKKLTRQFIQERGLPPPEELDEIIRQMWALPEREYQYAALDLLWRRRRDWEADILTLIEHLIVMKAWWDTVDALASHEVGEYHRRFPEQFGAWNGRFRQSDNIWLRRTAILFQLGYKDKTDQDLLFATIEENLGSTEFFINKAIGWALREHSKREETAVVTFVNQTDLASLSKREALKWLKAKGRL